MSCHTLADAGATGSVGPNLDERSHRTISSSTRVTDGKGVMPPFKDQLTEQQIQDVAAYVSSVAGYLRSPAVAAARLDASPLRVRFRGYGEVSERPKERDWKSRKC